MSGPGNAPPDWMDEIDAAEQAMGVWPDPSEDWRSRLILVRRPKAAPFPLPCVENAVVVLRNHPAWRDVIAYDAFEEATVKLKDPPWSEDNAPSAGSVSRIWSDTDSARAMNWLLRNEGLRVSPAGIEQAVALVAEARATHPVRDYLLGLKWDAKQRLPTWLHDYLGVAPSDYAGAIGLRWLVSAVARVMRPGCQVDCTLLIEGEQGLGKTSALRSLVPTRSWYADSGIVMGDKDSYQNLRGVWIYGLDELDSLRRGEMTRTKNFLTQTQDRYRPTYGVRSINVQRQNVFAGTTNEEEYLNDATGNRRFWPIRAGKIHIDRLVRDRDQLWAEAKARFDSGENWYVDTPDLRKQCASETEQRQAHDSWVDVAAEWLKNPTKRDQFGNPEPMSVDRGIAASDLILHALGMTPKELNFANSKRAGDVLRKLGFGIRKQIRRNGKIIWVFVAA